MADAQKPKPDRFDRGLKLLTPIINSFLVAFLAFYSNWAINQYASRQENARLITQLQIEREQAESDLRKDVFQQAIGSLLSEDELKSTELPISKRLLKLELLAENFGGSLSITPLFGEFDRDLEKLENAAGDNFNEEARIKSLRKRLRSVAKRLSSNQLSALAQHGRVFEFKVPLKPGGKKFADASLEPGKAEDGNLSCKQKLADASLESVKDDDDYSREYKWPNDAAAATLKAIESTDSYADLVEQEKREKGVRTLNGIERHVSVTLGDLDPQRRAVKVTLEICWSKDKQQPKTQFECDNSRDATVSRTFTLDHFNFPKVNNTRLSDNQRFSIVLEEFEPDPDKNSPGFLEVAAVIFPAEYSSLRDRPSMQESVNLLNTVLKQQNTGDEEEEDNDEEDSDEN